MRPSALDSLFAQVEKLPGIGPKMSRVLAGFTGNRVIDLMFHLPANLVDRNYRPAMSDAEEGRIASFSVEIITTARRAAICPIGWFARMKPAF